MKSFWTDLSTPFFVLAPMEAVTDVVFRHVVTRAGRPDIYVTEFTNATGWVHAGQKAIGARLVKTDDESPIVAQIWGGEPGDMQALAAHCVELGFDGIDINMGCPAKSAIKSGGSALIRQPELAVAAIAAAKTAGLPVSVKTRLGYTYVDEWREWLGTLLRQDIVALTVHLRTKKEMSKVPAHHELIPEIVALRDELAPDTLLIINGDIRDRAHGLELVAQYPGVNGIMIGRGVFQNPFCFADVHSSPLACSPSKPSETASRPMSVDPPSADNGVADVSSDFAGRVSLDSESRDSTATLSSSPKVVVTNPGNVGAEACPSEDCREDKSSRPAARNESADMLARREEVNLRGSEWGARDVRPSDGSGEDERIPNSRGEWVGAGEQVSDAQQSKLDLFYYHLDLFDKYQTTTNRPYETLKRFYKIYIRDFDGASELRDKLMHTTSTKEARQVVSERFGQ